MFKVPKLSNLKVLKFGAAITAASAVGAYGAGFVSAQPGFRKENGKELAKTALITGTGLTAAVLARKHVARAGVAGGKAFAKSIGKDSKVIFRRIRGRIIAIRK